MGLLSRRNQVRLVLAFIALQAAIPLGYYVGSRGDDERFSWRMFSTRRLLRCGITVHEQAGPRRQQVDIRRDVHVAWYEVLRRNRPSAVDRYLERRCALSDASRTVYRRQCVRSDGYRVPPVGVTRRCADGTVTRVEAE